LNKINADNAPLTAKIRFALFSLAAAQGFGSMGQMVMATLSAIIGATLSPLPELATLPVGAGVIGIAAATLPTAWLCRRFGRRPAFVAGMAWGALGSILAAYAIHIGSFAGFCCGCFIMGNNIAVVAQYRFAVTEFVPADRVSRAVALLMLGTLLAALAAPELALRASRLLQTEFSGSFVLLPLSYFAAAFFAILVPLGRPKTAPDQVVKERPLRQSLTRPPVQLAIASAALGFATMSLIMTATPISMHVMARHSVEATAGVIQVHLLAMFTPSLISGWLIARLGINRMLWLGVLCNIVCIFIAISGQEIWQYRMGLIALGIGWNLLFVSGTSLLATACSPDEILRVQGVNDLAMFGTMAVASLSAGAMLNGLGWTGINLIALTLIMLVVAALLRNRNHTAG